MNFRYALALVCVMALLQFFVGCRKPGPPAGPNLDVAAALYQDGKLAESLAEVGRILSQEIGPELKAEAMLLKAKVLMEMGDFEGAIAAIDSILEPPEGMRFEMDYVTAKSLIFTGALERARRLISSIEASEPTPEYAVKLQLLKAFHAAKSGECDRARELAEVVVWSGEGLTLAEGQYVKAFCLLGAGRHADALNLSKSALSALRPGYERSMTYIIAALSAAELKDFILAVDYYVAAEREFRNLADSTEFEKVVSNSIERLLMSKMDRVSLQAVIDKYGTSSPADIATFALARRLIRSGENSVAEKILADFSMNFPTSRWTKLASDVHNMLVMGLLGDTRRIGLIAPLTGDLSDFGQEVLLGAKMAVSDYMSASEASIALIVRDSQGDPDLAEEAFLDLAENENVIAVIGPVLSKSVSSTAESATTYRMVSFSPSACGIDALGDSPYVLRNCLPLWTQARAIARYAVGRLRLLRIAVLMPETQYGTLLADAFIDEADRAGADIIFIKSYPDGELGFSDRLAGLCELEPEGIFIADYASQVSVIAPQIEYNNIHDAVLLGWDGWNSPSALAPVINQLDGAFFVTGFWLDEETTAANALQERLLLERNVELSPLLAQSYDAAAILCEALYRGAFYRQDLRDEVSWSEHAGILGRYGFTAEGQATRPLKVLAVANGQIVKVCDIEAR